MSGFSIPETLSMRLVGRNRWLLSVATVGAIACDPSRVVAPWDLARLNQAEAQWQARPFTDYQYEIRTSCYCPPEIANWVRVTVRGGVVVSAEAVDPDPDFPITNLQLWQPIDSLFSRLRRVMSDPASSEFYAAVEAQYHDELGYPLHIDYRAHENIADGGSTHQVRNLEPISPDP